jgi:pre-mRNA-splicing factor CWC26
MSLAEYLAKNYLTADDQPTKKKKRKRTTNLDVIDDSTTSLPASTANNTDGTPYGDNDDDTSEAQIVGDIIQDRPSIPREKRWKPAVKFEDQDRPDEQPTLELDAEAQADLLMESGAKAGLQTAAEVKAAIERKQRRDMEEFKRSTFSGKEHETTYRDATGRRLDPMLKRAEIRAQEELRKKEERETNAAEEQRQKDLRTGLAQRRAADDARAQLAKQQTQNFANTRDDEELNEMLKERERWNDPAAAFLSKAGKMKKKEGKRFGRNVPVYMGAAPPNRFGIRPGFRWDGVDRSNGFEKLWFQKQNEKKAWQEEWDRWEAGADD